MMRYLLLIVVLTLSFLSILSIPSSDAKEIQPYKKLFGKEYNSGSRSCQKIKKILTDQIGKVVTIPLKGTDTVLVGVVDSIDDDVVKVDTSTLPNEEDFLLYIPVCSIGMVGIPQ